MHCGLLLLFTFYSNTTNSDKNTLFGTFQIKIRKKDPGFFQSKNFLQDWFRNKLEVGLG
jgi:hypothetical protein